MQVIYPIHKNGSHWVLMLVKRTAGGRCYDIQWFDSYHQDGSTYKDLFERLYKKLLADKDMANDNCLEPPNFSMVTVLQQDLDIPKQPNTVDCGVFVCAFAYCLVHDLPLDTFKAHHMTFFREHMLLTVSSGKLESLIEYQNSDPGLVSV